MMILAPLRSGTLGEMVEKATEAAALQPAESG